MSFNGKTNWQFDEVVKESDLNRIEQGIVDAHARVDDLTPEKIGAETPQEAQQKVDILKKLSIVARGFLESGTDLNAVITNGIYRTGASSNYVNGPSESDWALLLVYNNDGYVVQELTTVLGNKKLCRARTETDKWTGWEEIMTNGKSQHLWSKLDVTSNAQVIGIRGSDHAYISFFAKQGTDPARSGYFGYGSGNSNDLTLHNEIGSFIVIDANGRFNVGWEINNLKSSVASGKQLIATTIGGLPGDQAFQYYADHINWCKIKLANNLISKGIPADGSEQLSPLVDKVGNVKVGKQYAEATLKFDGDWEIKTDGIKAQIPALGFTPTYVVIPRLFINGVGGWTSNDIIAVTTEYSYYIHGVQSAGARISLNIIGNELKLSATSGTFNVSDSERTMKCLFYG